MNEWMNDLQLSKQAALTTNPNPPPPSPPSEELNEME